jgi:hypothetical protein
MSSGEDIPALFKREEQGMCDVVLGDWFFHSNEVNGLSFLACETLPATRGRLLTLIHDCTQSGSNLKSADEIDRASAWFNPDRGSYAELMRKAGLVEKTEDGVYFVSFASKNVDRIQKKRKSIARARKSIKPSTVDSLNTDCTQTVDRLYSDCAQTVHSENTAENSENRVKIIEPIVKDPIDRNFELSIYNNTSSSEVLNQSDKSKNINDTVNALRSRESLVDSQFLVVSARKSKSRWSDSTRKKAHSFLVAFCEAWKARYGTNPEGIKNPILRSKLLDWITHVSEERAVEMAKAYLSLEDKWIAQTRRHSLQEFFNQLDQIGIAVDVGSQPGDALAEFLND